MIEGKKAMERKIKATIKIFVRLVTMAAIKRKIPTAEHIYVSYTNVDNIHSIDYLSYMVTKLMTSTSGIFTMFWSCYVLKVGNLIDREPGG